MTTDWFHTSLQSSDVIKTCVCIRDFIRQCTRKVDLPVSDAQCNTRVYARVILPLFVKENKFIIISEIMIIEEKWRVRIMFIFLYPIQCVLRGNVLYSSINFYLLKHRRKSSILNELQLNNKE